MGKVCILEGDLADMINSILDLVWVMQPLVYTFWSNATESEKEQFTEQLGQCIHQTKTTAFFTCMG